MDQNKEKIRPPSLIILGTQRSGTTLLTRILSSHNDLFLQNEISVESVFISENLEDILDNIDKQIQKRHGQTINNLLTAKKKAQWGLKDPEFTYHLGSLRLFTDKTKFIHLVRDGRGVVNSYINNKWGLGTTAYTGALRWNREVSLIESFLSESKNDSLTIRFEDLVSSPEKTLKRICEFLDLDYKEELLLFYKENPNYKINASNKNTNSALSSAFADQWRDSFSESEVEAIEFVGQRNLEKFGYNLTTNCKRPSWIKRFASCIHQAVVGEMQIQYQLKRIKFKRMLKAKNA
tara:strand:+ start:204 stop:1079 length:876 start_codon:yes stop_codon:yes gene_type:complete